MDAMCSLCIYLNPKAQRAASLVHRLMALPTHQSWVGQVALLAKHAKPSPHAGLIPAKAPPGMSWIASNSSAMLTATLGSREFSLKVQLKEHTLWHFDLFTHEGLALHLLTPPATGVAYVLLLMQLTAADSAYVRANANAAAEGMHGTQAQGPGHISSAVSCSTALCFKFMDAAGGQAFEGLLQAAWAQKEQSESANTALHAQRQAQLAQMQAVQHQQQQRGDSAAGGLRARYPSGSDAAGQAGDALELGQMLGAGAGRAGGTSMRMGQGGLQYSVEDIQSAIQVYAELETTQEFADLLSRVEQLMCEEPRDM